MSPSLSETVSRMAAMLALVVTLLGQRSVEGCFDRNNALDPANTWTWLQPLSMENRLYYQLTSGSPDTMEVESEPNLPEYVKRTYTCLKQEEEEEGAGEGQGDQTMLVEVLESRGRAPDQVVVTKQPRFQCLRFHTLAPYVVRIYKSKLRASRKKVHCGKEKYSADQALLIAHNWVKATPCPLVGGYQVLLHEGEIIRGHCVDSIREYNPSFRFQCDGHNVVADLGRDCEPQALLTNHLLRNRHITHLTCVGSWSETDDIKAVLLRMRDQPYTFWCIHYREINKGSKEVLGIFMTFDGRCVPEAFHDESIPSKTSLFGQFVSYVPADDPRCMESEYLDQCRTASYNSGCSDSNDCPANCQRCNRKPIKSGCSFMEHTRGSWTTVNSRHQAKVDVITHRIRVNDYGVFYCRGGPERDLPGHIYPVVQANETSTCLPLYACAKVYSPMPGLLQFYLRPAWRDENTGDPFSCKQTDDKIGYVTPAIDERTYSMINVEKLKKSHCGFTGTQKFPTMIDGCMLKVDACKDDCEQLHISFDNDTCDQATQRGFPMITSLRCYGSFELTDSIRGLLTYSDLSDSYYCWVLTSSRLFITSPQDCNGEKATSILADRDATITYDPANRLSRPLTAKSNRNDNNAGCILLCNTCVIVTLLLLWICCLVM